MDSHRKQTAPGFLVIRRDNIGDLICTTPVFTALRRKFPEARVCALVNTYTLPVLEHNPDIDVVYAYTKAKHRPPGKSALAVHWQNLRLLWRLRRERFDYAILAGSSFQHHALRLARQIAPRHIIGYLNAGRRAARHIDIGLAPPTTPGHEVENVYRLLGPLEIGGAPPPMRVYLTEAELAAAQVRLQTGGLPPHRMLVGVHISARERANQWPLENFIELIARLHREHNAAFLLLWAPGSDPNPLYPGDDASARRLIEALPGVPILPLATHTVRELMSGVSLCQLLVGCDGGAIHVAAALGKPVLGLYCEVKKTRWYPWGVPHAQLVATRVGDITVTQATEGFTRLTRMLAETPASAG